MRASIIITDINIISQFYQDNQLISNSLLAFMSFKAPLTLIYYCIIFYHNSSKK